MVICHLNTEMGKVLEQEPILVTVIIPSFGQLIYTIDRKVSNDVSDVHEDLHCARFHACLLSVETNAVCVFCLNTFFVWKHLRAYTQIISNSWLKLFFDIHLYVKK